MLDMCKGHRHFLISKAISWGNVLINMLSWNICRIKDFVWKPCVWCPSSWQTHCGFCSMLFLFQHFLTVQRSSSSLLNVVGNSKYIWEISQRGRLFFCMFSCFSMKWWQRYTFAIIAGFPLRKKKKKRDWNNKFLVLVLLVLEMLTAA